MTFLKKILVLLSLILVLLISTASAATINSPHGFTMSFDPSIFSYEVSDTLEIMRYQTTTDSDYPAYMVFSEVDGYTSDEVIEGIALQSGVDGEFGTMLINHTEANTYRYYTSTGSDSLVNAYLCFTESNGNVFLVELAWVYDAQHAVGVYFYNMLSTLFSDDTVLLTYEQCPDCKLWFARGDDYNLHDCVDPSLWIATDAADAVFELVYCELCDGWYEAGNVYRNHVCLELSYPDESTTSAGYVYCELCGGWYEEGNVYRNHVCNAITYPDESTDSTTEPNYAYCELCGGWYEEGNVFRNHVCNAITYPDESTDSTTEPNYVYCELCGGWYEEGNVFRNHVCNAITYPDESTESASVYCEICGNWYEEGNVFRNHMCISYPAE